MTIHPAAARGFARSADAYERSRPAYPRSAIEWLRERLGLGPGKTVIDLAAGTGKLSRPLAATGAEVVAVEPLAEMRMAIGPHIRAVEGTAESIPVREAGADAVTVGQAFHWFAHGAALAEMHRVLRPGGMLALVWNRRRLEDPIHAAVEQILSPYHRDVPTHRSDAWRAAFDSTSLFGALEERTFANAQVLDADGLADRFASTSFIAALRDGERHAVLARIRALGAAGPVTLRYVAEVQVSARTPGRL